MQLFSRHQGEGENALIILHGLLGSSANWQSLAKRFGQKRHVYTLDMRNHGQSPWSATMHYQAMAEDVAQFIDSLSHRHISLMGHSMGGKAAMQLALNYPEKIDALIVADIAPVRYSHEYRGLIEPMLAIDLDTLKTRAQADNALQTAISNDGIRAFLLHNLSFDREQQHWSWRPNLKALLENMQNIIGFDDNHVKHGRQFDQPCLFIHGAHSDYVQIQHEDLIHQLFPHAELRKLEQAGHWLHAEQPQAFVAAYEQFNAEYAVLN